ncbi:MAG: DUF4136 domain-containing protein [Polyangiaceae bacterium]
MIKMMMVSALVCVVPAVVGACSPVRSHSAGLATAPFPQYRTFSFGTGESSPAGFKSSPRTAEVERRMLPIVAAVLQEKGYAAAETGKKGDVVVACASGARKGIKRPASASSHGAADGLADDEEEDFVEGAIVIDMFDGTNDGQVWHGAARAEVNPDKIDDQLLQRAVREVLAPFPVHATSGPQAAR